MSELPIMTYQEQEFFIEELLYKINTLDQQLAKERETNRWIPVSERLPELNKHVLAFGPIEGFIVAGYTWSNRFNEHVWMAKGEPMYLEVTHWKPINPPLEVRV